MLKIVISTMLLASTSYAGEATTNFYYIIGAIPTEIPAQSEADFASKAYRDRVGELSEMWTEACGADVFAWTTNLISNEDTPFTPDMWVGILATGATEAELEDEMPESPCATQGYVAYGSLLFPSSYQYCTFGDGSTPEWAQACE